MAVTASPNNKKRRKGQRTERNSAWFSAAIEGAASARANREPAVGVKCSPPSLFSQPVIVVCSVRPFTRPPTRLDVRPRGTQTFGWNFVTAYVSGVPHPSLLWDGHELLEEIVAPVCFVLRHNSDESPSCCKCVSARLFERKQRNCRQLAYISTIKPLSSVSPRCRDLYMCAVIGRRCLPIRRDRYSDRRQTGRQGLYYPCTCIATTTTIPLARIE